MFLHAKSSVAALSVGDIRKDIMPTTDIINSETYSSGDDDGVDESCKTKRNTAISRLTQAWKKLPLWTNKDFAERLAKFLSKCDADEIIIDHDRVSRRRKVSPKKDEGGIDTLCCILNIYLKGAQQVGCGEGEVQPIGLGAFKLLPLPPPPRDKQGSVEVEQARGSSIGVAASQGSSSSLM